ncbi:MAG: hypothetical protein JWL69_3653, partial [Phycisphaerales bacterium]|nr:hypothetical protein [Phycisphaerales bacterium]
MSAGGLGVVVARAGLARGHQHVLRHQALRLVFVGGPLGLVVNDFLQMLLERRRKLLLVHWAVGSEAEGAGAGVEQPNRDGLRAADRG